MLDSHNCAPARGEAGRGENMQYVDIRSALSLMRLIHQHHVLIYDKVMLSGVLPSIAVWLRIAICELQPRHSSRPRELPNVRTMLKNAI